MHRLLIVDDEPIIVDGLVQLFEDNKKYEFDICKAYTANNALDILKKTKIDVILLDIRMPGMSGLQLADQVALYWPLCKIIFLTGYDEFDYVYTAIKKPGVNYILKTEGDEAIVSAVENAVSKLIEEAEQRITVEKAKKQIAMIIPLLRKDLFNSIINGYEIDEANMKERFQELGIELDITLPVLVLAGWVDYWPENLSYPDKIYMLGMVEEMFSKQLSHRVKYEYIIFDNKRLILLLQPGEKIQQFRDKSGDIDWAGLKAYVKATLEVIQDTCRGLYGFDISFVLAGEAVKWSFVNNELDLIRSMMEKRSLSGQQMLIDLGMPNEIFNIEQRFLSISETEFSEKISLLEKYLDKGMDKELEELCVEILTGLKESLMDNYLISIERYYSFLLTFISYINRGSMYKKLSKDINVEKVLLMDLPIKWDKAEKFFVGLGRYICMSRKEQESNENNIVIERIHQYINENISEDLSLTKLAEVVYFNPSYLSRFYKQMTRRNLSEYINTIKFETSKKMLQDSNLKISEIGFKIGFEAPSCFTAFFKKMAKMTPQEYRESLLRVE